MHRRKRSLAVFIFPVFAVAVIAMWLLLHPWGGIAIRGPIASVSINPVVSTNRSVRPRILPADPLRHEAIESLGKTRRTTRHRRRTPHRDTTAHQSLPMPWDRPANVSLHAPLLDAQDEMAGLDAAFEPFEPFGSVGQTVAVAKPVSTEVTPAIRRTTSDGRSNAWPPTPALDAMLTDGLEVVAARGWIERVRDGLAELQSYRTLGDHAAGQTLDQLSTLSTEGLAAAEQLADRGEQLKWLRLAHSLQRRLAVWQPIWNTTRQHSMQLASSGKRFTVDTAEVRRRAAVVAKACEQTGDAAAWHRFLLLHRVSDPAMPTDAAARRITAQRLLSRIEWDGLSEAQRQWLQQPAVQDLADAVRPWAAGPVDYPRLLQQLERQESDAIDLVAIDVAATTQTMRFAAGPQPHQVADAINAYYRNANLRVAISETFLNRLLPDMPERAEPVSQNILGTRIQGTSQIASDLRVELLPSPEQWALRVHTDGQIHARTVGRNGPVTLRNASDAQFQAHTDVIVDAEGVRLQAADASVQQQTYLRGLQTDYDGVPLIGSLVRGIAMSKYRDARSRSQRIATARLERTIAAGLDQEFEQQVHDKTQRLTDQLLGPLAGLRLAPTVVDLQTDQQRLTARYRLAGDWQLAASTPRPRAMSDSLLSVQVHQSALNNTCERLAPSDEPRAIAAVAEELLEMFGRDASAVPEELPTDVYLQFSKTRPVTLEVDNDRMWLTFRLLRLTREGGLDLRHFIVRACYRGEVDGMHARFVREGHLSIKGARMSLGQRVAVRAIFNKVLNENQPLPLTSERLAEHPATAGTEISQLELRDGWIAFAIAPQR
ncbi:hypothetical protein [Roseimaritima ulvae]|uniref:Uncharacterized protein n=1 Tax=Roseimaritima ulvae TaxID=980254 RepID=A0A5B9QNM6_9BACT|nr:hypothetical protein [Roseimaritima ulvae]QEG38616.1 hypothetical protein UC8_05730 [Roseimaritima ulvae]